MLDTQENQKNAILIINSRIFNPNAITYLKSSTTHNILDVELIKIFKKKKKWIKIPWVWQHEMQFQCKGKKKNNKLEHPLSIAGTKS